jgi:hypothetical protein
MSRRPVLTAAVVGALLVVGGAAPVEVKTPLLTQDQLCELWIAHTVRSSVDTWPVRHAVSTTCVSEGILAESKWR